MSAPREPASQLLTRNHGDGFPHVASLPAESLPEPEEAAGIWRQRGGRHDAHLPDFPHRPVWQPDAARPEGGGRPDPRHRGQPAGEGHVIGFM